MHAHITRCHSHSLALFQGNISRQTFLSNEFKLVPAKNQHSFLRGAWGNLIPSEFPVLKIQMLQNICKILCRLIPFQQKCFPPEYFDAFFYSSSILIPSKFAFEISLCTLTMGSTAFTSNALWKKKERIDRSIGLFDFIMEMVRYFTLYSLCMCCVHYYIQCSFLRFPSLFQYTATKFLNFIPFACSKYSLRVNMLRVRSSNATFHLNSLFAFEILCAIFIWI